MFNRKIENPQNFRIKIREKLELFFDKSSNKEKHATCPLCRKNVKTYKRIYLR